MATSVRTGILVFVTDESVSPAVAAAAAEERGFESVWFPEHSHLPEASRGWPGGPSIPPDYARTVDQWVCLGAAAAATSNVRLGTAMCLVPQHDPIWLAKQVASVDHLSGGRLTLGVGYGWNRAELAHHGVDFASRRDRTRECIAAMSALWHDEVASYEGNQVAFGPSRAWPKPVQSPHPPILVGAGAGPRTTEDIATWADGWAPLYGRDDVPGRLDAVRAAWKAAGRAVDDLDLSVFGVPPKPEAIEEVLAWAPRRVVFGAGAATEPDLARQLDRIAAAVAAA